jgi:prophage regulatory protein
MSSNTGDVNDGLKLFLTAKEVSHATTLGLTAVWALIHTGDFPPPRLLSKGRSGWLLSEVVAWAETRPVSKLPPPPNAGAGATTAARQARANKECTSAVCTPLDQQTSTVQ